ncbi:MAG TPA: cyclic nucleotide-binding domain-containing protein [Bryobacteraceae bacterium]|nr:cyclic nucleotide-binding domain-containing protein [Bryobacteraceae bacterium]
METIERILAQHPFFEGLDTGYIKLLTGCASNVRFDAGAYIFREAEEADCFYLIRQGKVALEIRAPQRPPLVIETLEEGEILGWSWVIPPYYWRFDARVVEPVRAFALDGKCLRGKCEKDHDLGYELLKRFSHIVDERLQTTRLQLLDVYGAHA